MFNWTASAWPILASAALKSTLVLGAAWLITVSPARAFGGCAPHGMDGVGGGAGGAAVALGGAARAARPLSQRGAAGGPGHRVPHDGSYGGPGERRGGGAAGAPAAAVRPRRRRRRVASTARLP